MRWMILTGVVAAGLAAVGTASATPRLGDVPPIQNGDIVQVEGGCGPYGFRDFYGYCRPRRIYAPVPPPPRAFYGCPRGFRPTPYGCRPFY